MVGPPPAVKGPIMRELEARFELLFEKLKVTDTADIVRNTVNAVIVKKQFNSNILGV